MIGLPYKRGPPSTQLAVEPAVPQQKGPRCLHCGIFLFF